MEKQAGFGKTTVVSEWVQAIGRATPPIAITWLSLDEGDKDPTRFLVYLITALQSIDATLAQGALSALQSPQPPVTETILVSLINEIAATPRLAVPTLVACRLTGSLQLK